MKVYYHSDENCRPGCHVVSRGIETKTGLRFVRLFSVDEVGAWWDESYNLHCDGCDYPVNSREAAIRKGLYLLGLPDYTEIVEAGPFYE